MPYPRFGNGNVTVEHLLTIDPVGDLLLTSTKSSHIPHEKTCLEKMNEGLCAWLLNVWSKVVRLASL